MAIATISFLASATVTFPSPLTSAIVISSVFSFAIATIILRASATEIFPSPLASPLSVSVGIVVISLFVVVAVG